MKDPFYVTESDEKEFLKIYLDKYDTLYYQNKLNEILKLLPSNIRDKTILDIGCCGGYLSVLLSKMGAKVTGIDKSENAIKAAKYYNNRENDNNCIFIQSELKDIITKFDIIIAKDVIEHIDDDKDFISNCYNRLKFNGLLILQTQNSFSLNYLIEKPIRFLIGQRNWKGWDSTHIRFYNYKSFNNLLKKKFREIKYCGSYYIPYLFLTKSILKFEPKCYSNWRLFTLIDKYLGHIFPLNKFGWSITVSGVKR